jgi:hypothetical protein
MQKITALTISGSVCASFLNKRLSRLNDLECYRGPDIEQKIINTKCSGTINSY